MGSPKPFYLVEQGAGDATLATDILEAISLLNSDLYSGITYICVDRQKIDVEDEIELQSIQSDHLEILDQPGIIFSNELIDSFPVKMIEVVEGGIFEVFVDIDHNGDFNESLLPISKSGIKIVLPKGFETLNGYRGPLNTRVSDWYSNISKVLSSGFIVTVDYGFNRNIYYSMEKSHRLLQTYYRHTDGSSPYQRIGSQDMTAHVDFDSLREMGANHGLKEHGYYSQAEWLDGLGLGDVLRNIRSNHYEGSRKAALISRLADISGFGAFKVLIQSKNLEIIDDAELHSGISWPSGLKYPCVRNTHMAYPKLTNKIWNSTAL